ncbi:tryptophan-rich sensory protein [Pararhizobium capsulatum DSM 1112]|uniref:Tryptophan-rich sensory protein n=1 Tax=Pararhizobium capsulatum DSM 1112 TaxID=1121113 RepID=A0ABU0BL84_9HYPH|nr:TspO/MBR family protein [Pararhizobium capsulatum]MDQ0318668.1 tryptophan-rich sensory protein [Pararhizobium capsulatum DSM 1112]
MSKPLVYALFIILVVGCGLLIGINNIPGEWYQSLAKPAFNPPNWIFGPVWTLLYVIIGFVGARSFLHHRHSPMMRLWVAQMIFNFAWSPLFFGLQEIALALIVILALLVSLALFLAVTYGRDRLSFLLFLPYLAWVAFASLLNLSIFLMN